MYECKECGKAVIVLGEKKIRSCKHTGTIVMSLEGSLEGKSKLNG